MPQKRFRTLHTYLYGSNTEYLVLVYYVVATVYFYALEIQAFVTKLSQGADFGKSGKNPKCHINCQTI